MAIWILAVGMAAAFVIVLSLALSEIWARARLARAGDPPDLWVS